MRICSGAGCLRAVSDGIRYCDDCKCAVRPDDGIRQHKRVTEMTLALADRDVYGFLYSSHRWQRLRAIAVRHHPMCDRCERDFTEIIDHRVPAGIVIIQAQMSGRYTDKYAGFFFLTNLQGLCRSCHAVKTAEDKAHTGVWQDAVSIEVRSNSNRVYAF